MILRLRAPAPHRALVVWFALCVAGSTPFTADSQPGQETAPSLSHSPFFLHTADRVVLQPHPVAYLLLDMGGQQEVVVWQAFLCVNPRSRAPPPRGPPLLA